MAELSSDDNAGRKLGILRAKEEEESTKLLAEKHQLPYVDLSIFPIEVDAIKTVREEEARKGELAVFQMTGRRLKIAVRNPEKPETKGVLASLRDANYTYELFLASRRSVTHAWEFYKKVPEKHEVTAGMITVSAEHVENLQKEIRGLEDIKSRIEATFKARTTEALEIILAGSLALDASDIHVEPQEADVRLRFRIDGILYDVVTLPTPLFLLLLSRIKLVAEMKLNIHDKAQDGRFTIRTGGADVEIRVSILPGPYGENIVLRVLDPKAIKITFEELGMQPWVITTIDAELKKPNGMVITTGPTGSGKTTTLYAFLKKIHTPDIKIITIEDPIEYHLVGVEQTQVNHERGYDFANGLRAIVRQDPDVILVGEIRDKETAETAIHASLTGHLVFSTLHTNNAAGTVPRLIDLGIKANLIAPAVNVTMAQRLIRKLCPDCKTKTPFNGALKEKIAKELKEFPKGTPVPDEKNWAVFSARTGECSRCGGTGYKGRVGIYEIILMDDAMERLIAKEPSESEVKEATRAQGQITMRQDGVLKVLAGLTDFTELDRMMGE